MDRKQLKDTAYQRTIHLLCFAVIAGVVCFLLVRWRQLPQRIPTHFNFSGQIDGYGAKETLWLYPALMAVSFGLLLLVERRPRSWNTGVRVTPYNQSFVYRTLKSMIVTLELCLVGIFGAIGVCAALGIFPLWLTVGIVTVPAPVIIGFLIALFRGAKAREWGP